ncbi:sugar phosphate isomerase/epimerase [Microbacterium pumilum]|uniref:Myo-inosose-2 dehydratase n=1 Tax=Microbacterium pumilum TaxID=344165 RepID=A0ABP5DHY0_9MICO
MSALRRAFSKPVAAGELGGYVSGFRAEGYEGLQLKGAQYERYIDTPERALDELGTDVGIYSGLIMGDSLDPQGLARIDKVIDFAATVGAERIIFCHGHPHEGVDRELRRSFAQTLAGVAASAHDRGVRFSLHHHTDQPVMVLSDFHEFFEGMEPGLLGLTVDTAHLARSGVEDLPGFIDEFGGFVDNVHLKDYADDDWRIVGRGDLDLVGVLTALDRAGYDGWLCIDEESSASLPDGFRMSREWLEAQGR